MEDFPVSAVNLLSSSPPPPSTPRHAAASAVVISSSSPPPAPSPSSLDELPRILVRDRQFPAGGDLDYAIQPHAADSTSLRHSLSAYEYVVPAENSKPLARHGTTRAWQCEKNAHGLDDSIRMMAQPTDRRATCGITGRTLRQFQKPSLDNADRDLEKPVPHSLGRLAADKKRHANALWKMTNLDGLSAASLDDSAGRARGAKQRRRRQNRCDSPIPQLESPCTANARIRSLVLYSSRISDNRHKRAGGWVATRPMSRLVVQPDRPMYRAAQNKEDGGEGGGCGEYFPIFDLSTSTDSEADEALHGTGHATRDGPLSRHGEGAKDDSKGTMGNDIGALDDEGSTVSTIGLIDTNVKKNVTFDAFARTSLPPTEQGALPGIALAARMGVQSLADVEGRLSMAELKELSSSFGFKPFRSRKKLVQLITQCLASQGIPDGPSDATPPLRQRQRRQSSTQQSQTQAREELFEAISNVVRVPGNEIWDKILLYEPLELEWLIERLGVDHGIRITNADDLRAWCDMHGICHFLANGGRRRRDKT